MVPARRAAGDGGQMTESSETPVVPTDASVREGGAEPVGEDAVEQLEEPSGSSLIPTSGRVKDAEHWFEARPVGIGAWGLAIVVWTAFLVLLLISPHTLADARSWVLDLPVWLQVIVWIVTLPVMIALMAWYSGWAQWLRVAIVVACVLWTLIGFFPKDRPTIR
jgi:hypothetical protein